jgi:hypothetical protein
MRLAIGNITVTTQIINYCFICSNCKDMYSIGEVYPCAYERGKYEIVDYLDDINFTPMLVIGIMCIIASTLLIVIEIYLLIKRKLVMNNEYEEI